MNYANPRYNFSVIPKYGYVTFPLAILTLAICIKYLPKNLKIAGLTIIAVTSVFGLSNLYQAKNYFNPSYFNTFGNYKFVKSNSREGDALILNGNIALSTYKFYRESFFSSIKAMTINEATSTPKISTNRYWYFSTNAEGDSVDVPVIDSIPEGFRIINRFDDVPQDPTLKMYKERFLKRPGYTYKYSVFLLEKL